MLPNKFELFWPDGFWEVFKRFSLIHIYFNLLCEQNYNCLPLYLYCKLDSSNVLRTCESTQLYPWFIRNSALSAPSVCPSEIHFLEGMFVIPWLNLAYTSPTLCLWLQGLQWSWTTSKSNVKVKAVFLYATHPDGIYWCRNFWDDVKLINKRWKYKRFLLQTKI